MDDGFEENDDEAGATPILALAFPGMMICPDDDDWFVTASPVAVGDTVTAAISFIHANGDLDLSVGTLGVTLATSASTTDNEAVVWVSESNVEHFVRVFGTGVENTYDLNVRVCAAPQFACDDGATCLMAAQECDGTPDCASGFDEFPINPNCAAAPANAGDVVVSEVMKNPGALGEAAGEWFELHNTLAMPLDVGGCELSSVGTLHTIAGPLVIEAGGYISLARGASPGFVPDYVYADITFNNDQDEIGISCGGTLIDLVQFIDALGFPDTEGAALNLDAESLHHVVNNSSLVWCDATADQGNGDLGTPGAANAGCGDNPLETLTSASLLCELTPMGGPNGLDLHTCYIPAPLHPVADDVGLSCEAAVGGADLVVTVGGGPSVSATICNGTPGDGSVGAFDSPALATEIACNTDAIAETAGCAELADSGDAGPPTLVVGGANTITVVVDEPLAGSYWDGSTLRVIEVERG